MKQKEWVSSRQLMFAMACFLQSSTLLTNFVSQIAKQDVWLVAIIAYGVSSLIVGIYVFLASRFPGKSILEINSLVFGAVVGKIVSALYVFFFFCLSILNTNDVGVFADSFILPRTPMEVILAMFLFICVWSVRTGPENIVRMGQLFVIISFIVFVSNVILLSPQFNFDYFLPVLSQPAFNYVQTVHTMAMIPFSEVFIFFMYIPIVKDPQNLKKAWWGGLTMGAVLLVGVTIRDIATMGPFYSRATSPSFQVTRLINVGNLFTRMEFFYAILLIILMFFKVSVLLYATSQGTAQVLGLKDYRNLVPVLSVLIACFAMTAFNNQVAGVDWGARTAPIFNAFFLVILPLLTVLAYAVRKMAGHMERRLT